jgi:hypothetical protein
VRDFFIANGIQQEEGHGFRGNVQVCFVPRSAGFQKSGTCKMLVGEENCAICLCGKSRGEDKQKEEESRRLSAGPHYFLSPVLTPQ